MRKYTVMCGDLAFGGAFAATGTGRITQMLNGLSRRGGGAGLLTACGAGGLAAAMIVGTD